MLSKKPLSIQTAYTGWDFFGVLLVNVAGVINFRVFGFDRREHWKDIRIPNRFIHEDNSGNIHNIKKETKIHLMEWLTSSLLPRQGETKCRQKEGQE